MSDLRKLNPVTWNLNSLAGCNSALRERVWRSLAMTALRSGLLAIIAAVVAEPTLRSKRLQYTMLTSSITTTSRITTSIHPAPLIIQLRLYRPASRPDL